MWCISSGAAVDRSGVRGTTFVRSACGIDPMVQQRGGAHLVLIPGAEEGEEPMWFDSLVQQWRGAYLE